MEKEFVEALRASPIRLGEGATGQAAMTRAPVQIPDMFELARNSASRMRPLLRSLGYRSLLGGADTSRAADHGRVDGLAATGRGVSRRKL